MAASRGEGTSARSRGHKETAEARGRKQLQKTASRQPATQRGWPEEREKSKEKNKKNEGGGDRKKKPGKAKHLHFKGVGPKSGGGPEFPKSPKNEINKKSSTRPKSFWEGGAGSGLRRLPAAKAQAPEVAGMEAQQKAIGKKQLRKKEARAREDMPAERHPPWGSNPRPQG